MIPAILRSPSPQVALVFAVAALAASAAAAHAMPYGLESNEKCARYAAVWGDNQAPGTYDEPFRTPSRLLRSLSPGDIGCLFAGRFEQNLTVTSGGQPGAPITLAGLTSPTAFRPATLAGILSVPDGVNDVVIENLVLDGTNQDAMPSPQVNGDRITFRDNEVTNGHTAICFALGGAFESYGRPRDTVLERNRIHHCGRLPVTNHDHGIYVEGADDVRIVDNFIYANADWGVHLYPDADNSYVAYNVIDGNGAGLIFAGERAGGEYTWPYASDSNVVERNIITNSVNRYNVESWWGGPMGVGNVARENCVWNGALGEIDQSRGGFFTFNNRVVDPLYVDRAAFDFRLQPGSPCEGFGPRQ